MTKTLGRRNRLGKMSSSPKPSQVIPQLIVQETEEKDISIKVKQPKVVVAVKAEETISTEATIQAGAIFKEEATIKADDIIKADDRLQVEEKLRTEAKAEAEDSIKAEAEISVKFSVGDVTKLEIMLKIVELLLIKFPSFIQTLHCLQMMKMTLMVQNMSSSTQNQQLYKFQCFLEMIMNMHGLWIQEQLNT